MTGLDYSDILRISRTVRVGVGQVKRTLEGEACYAVTAEQAARIRKLAAEALARTPPCRRVRLAEPGGLRS